MRRGTGWRPRRRRPALWFTAEVAAQCRHLSRHGFGLRPQRTLCGLGARSSFYAMKSRQQPPLMRPPAKAGDRSRSISDEALRCQRGRPGDQSSEGEGHRKVWARLRVCRGICFPQAWAPGDAREQPACPNAAAAVAEIPIRCDHHPMQLMWGTAAFGCSRGRRRAPDITAFEHWNAECVTRLAGMVCKTEATASPPFSRSPWGLQAVCLDLRRCAGAGTCGWITAPSICRSGFTNQIKFWGIQPSYAPSNSPRPTASPRVNRTLKEQIIHGRIYRNIAELRNASAGSSNSTCPAPLVEKNGYRAPLKLDQAWHTAMSLRPAA